MKKYIFLLLITVFFTSFVYANGIDELLRNLESPEVDYHIDNKVKVIVPPQYKIPNNDVNDNNFTTNQFNIYKIDNLPKLDKNKTNEPFLKKSESDIIKKIDKRSDEKVFSSPLVEKNKSEGNNKLPKRNQNNVSNSDLISSSKPKSNNNVKQSIKEEKNKDINRNNNKKANANIVSNETDNKFTVKNEKTTLTQKTDKQINIKSEKSLNVSKLFLFFKKMKFISDWQKQIKENLSFFKELSFLILDFWQREVDKEQQSLKMTNNLKEKENVHFNDIKNDELEKKDDDKDTEDEDDNSEEEEKVDYSKFDSILEKAEDLYKSSKWKELQTLFDENEEFDSVPAAQKYRLMLELNKAKPNINVVRNYAQNTLNYNNNSVEGNYGMAYFYFFNKKKRDLSKASTHIGKAIKGKKPLKEALILARKITLARYMIPVIVGIILIIVNIIIAIVIIKKKINKVKETSVESGKAENDIEVNLNNITADNNLNNKKEDKYDINKDNAVLQNREKVISSENEIIKDNVIDSNNDNTNFQENENQNSYDNDVIKDNLADSIGNGLNFQENQNTICSDNEILKSSEIDSINDNLNITDKNENIINYVGDNDDKFSGNENTDIDTDNLKTALKKDNNIDALVNDLIKDISNTNTEENNKNQIKNNDEDFYSDNNQKAVIHNHRDYEEEKQNQSNNELIEEVIEEEIIEEVEEEIIEEVIDGEEVEEEIIEEIIEEYV